MDITRSRFRAAAFGCVYGALLFSLPSLGLAQTQPPNTSQAAVAQPFKLDDATPVKMRLKETISSATAHVGDTVEFEVLDDLKINGVVVVSKGALAWGTVTEAQQKRRMGRGGKLNVNIDDVRLVDGEKCPLRSVQGGNAGGHVGAMTGAMVATGIVFFPAAPLFLFMHGKDITIPEGTQVTAYINGDMALDQAKFAPTASSPVTPTAQPGAPASGVAAKVDVLSTPSGCDITVDGKFVGDTPSTLELSAGPHTITVQKSGYQSWQRSMTIESGSNITINASLEPAK